MFRKELELWQFKESERKKNFFSEKFNRSCDGNEYWGGLQRELLGVARQVGGYTKGKSTHSEMWNRDVQWLFVERGIYLRSEGTFGKRKTKKCCKAEKDVKKFVSIAVQEEVEKVNSCRDGLELFRIGKQGTGEKRDVIGVNRIKDKSGVVKVGAND